MSSSFTDKYKNDPTPSWVVMENYRKVIEKEEHEQSLALLHFRGTQEEFDLGVEYCKSKDPLDRETGCCVLSQLGWNPKVFVEESVDALIPMLNDSDARVIAAAAYALGHRNDPRAIPYLIEIARHSDEDVRLGVVSGLSNHDDLKAIGALIVLTKDPDLDVRNWAVFGIGSMTEVDTPSIREALISALNDVDDEIRGEALVGLAERGDMRVVDALLQEWEHDIIGLLSVEAAGIIKDPRLLPFLEGFLTELCFDLDRDADLNFLSKLHHSIKLVSEALKSDI